MTPVIAISGNHQNQTRICSYSIMPKNNATRDTRILIYTNHDSSHMPIEVIDEASLERAFQDILGMSQEVCRLRPHPMLLLH